MWTSLKAGAQVVVKQIPVGIGMGIGVAIAGGLMSGLGKAFTKGADVIKAKKDQKLDKTVAEHMPPTTGGAEIFPR